MPKPGKPNSVPNDTAAANGSGALPDLLAGLLAGRLPRGTFWHSVSRRALTPEIMSPEEEMPLATPVNATMPEFLASLRTLLRAQDSPGPIGGHFPAEAAQDFAHGTNELLNYLLHEVVGTGELNIQRMSTQYSPEAAQDFETGTNELLNYLLSQVMNPHYPEGPEEIDYSPEAMADFEAGTQDLLNQLLSMADTEELNSTEPSFVEAEFSLASFPDADLLDGLMGSRWWPPSLKWTFLPFKSPLPEPQPEEIALEPNVKDLGRGLLDGLLANLTDSSAAAVADAMPSHGLGEVPLEYVDESDQADVERPAGPFEMLLDQIDSELPAPPRIRGIASSTETLSAGERFIAFELAGDAYALPFACVLETDRTPRFTYVPGMPVHLRGVLNLRGEIIPLVDLRTLLGLEARPGEGRMLVIGGSTAKTPLALVVDRLQGLESLHAR